MCMTSDSCMQLQFGKELSCQSYMGSHLLSPGLLPSRYSVTFPSCWLCIRRSSDPFSCSILSSLKYLLVICLCCAILVLASTPCLYSIAMVRGWRCCCVIGGETRRHRPCERRGVTVILPQCLYLGQFHHDEPEDDGNDCCSFRRTTTTAAWALRQCVMDACLRFVSSSRPGSDACHSSETSVPYVYARVTAATSRAHVRWYG